MSLFPRPRRLGTRLGLLTSSAILIVSLAFFGYRYLSETELLTDQLHAHMGENVAALTACLQRIERIDDIQGALQDFVTAVQMHFHEFGHHDENRHLVLVYDPNGRILASTEPRWIGRSMPAELLALSGPTRERARHKFRTVELEGARFLSLAEPVDVPVRGGTREEQRILYLEPYSSVLRLARDSLMRNLAFSLLLAAILVGAIHFLTRRLVIRRLELLAGSIEQIERNGLDVPIPELGGDELGALRDVYARTTADLRRSRQAIEEHASTLESQVRARTTQLLRAHRLAAVGELAAGLAHGLNNPLASVSASAEKLLDLLGRDPEQFRERAPEHLARIVRNTDRCKHIGQSLLSFAREREFSLQPLQLEPLLREALAVMESKAEARNIALRLDMSGALPDLVADPDALMQVLVNLLSNALDASRGGLTVALHATGSGDQVVLAVVDHGIGIAPEHLSQIFHPFFTTKPPEGGTGLGLSICHGIVGQLGGTITVASERGKGSRFEVRLPVSNPSPARSNA